MSQGMYVGRRVLNAERLQAWWEQNRSDVDPVDLDPNLHVSVIHSETEPKLAADQYGATAQAVRIGVLGHENAVVLFLVSQELHDRYEAYHDAGASSDYDAYLPHVTLFYLGDGYDGERWLRETPKFLTLPQFPILFGPELQGGLDKDVFAESFLMGFLEWLHG